MARVTVEDCLHSGGNRFELVLLATKRARQIANGAEPKVEPGYDKPAVVALREIASQQITPQYIAEVEKQEKEIAAQQALEWATAQAQLEDEDNIKSPATGAD